MPQLGSSTPKQINKYFFKKKLSKILQNTFIIPCSIMEVIKIWGKILPIKLPVLWAQLCKNDGCIYIKCWERIQRNEKERAALWWQYNSVNSSFPFISGILFTSKVCVFHTQKYNPCLPFLHGFLANSDHQSWIPFVDMTILGWGEQGSSLLAGGLLLWTLAHKLISFLALCILTSGDFSNNLK